MHLVKLGLQLGIAAAWLVVSSLLAALLALQPGVMAAAGERGKAVPAELAPLDVAQIDTFVREQVARHGIPGMALGIVEGNQIVHLAGYGRADSTGRAVTPETPFLLASVSKPLTALAIMQLVEAGEVELDAPVQQYVPEFRMADPAAAQITVRHLLLHTSGIPVTACDTRVGATTLAMFVDELKSVHLAAPVGSQHIYCSANYNLLGRVIERVTGQDFGSYMAQHVFAPLAMTHSFTNEQAARQAGLVQGHQWLFGLVVPMHHRFNASQLPAGYLIASAKDMSHFLIAQLDGGRFGDDVVLSAEGIAAMHAPGVSAGPTRGYGLGWQVGEKGGVPVVYHSGDNFDYHSLLVLAPETGRGLVLLFNANHVVASLTAFAEIEAGAVRLLVGKAPPAAGNMSLPTRYRIVNLLLVLGLGLAVWPLVRLPRWLRSQAGRLYPRHGRMRVVWELALPVLLLVAVRALLHQLGAQSWGEGFAAFPDLLSWLWTVALILLLTGIIRAVLVMRARRGAQDGKVPADAAA